MKNKISKGEYGHLDNYKRIRLIHGIIILFIIIALITISLIIFHSRKSILTIIACVMAIPFAERILGYFIVFKYKSVDKENHSKITAYDINDKLLYDVTVSNGDKILYYPVIFMNTEEIFIFDAGYTENRDLCRDNLVKVFELKDTKIEFFDNPDDFAESVKKAELPADSLMQEKILSLGV